VIGTDCTDSSESKLYFKDILRKIVTAVIRSQPVLNSQTIKQIFTWESRKLQNVVYIKKSRCSKKKEKKRGGQHLKKKRGGAT
jgi:hypothetical protein